MKNRISISTAAESDIVLLRPSDIAILVTAACGTQRLISATALDNMIPRECTSAVSITISLRINRLIQQLDKSTTVGNEIQMKLVFGDRVFFAEVLCAYHGQARQDVWARGLDSITLEEATRRRNAISERYADIFARLGGSGWTFGA